MNYCYIDMDLTGKTAVVFGGNGVIGSNLIQKLFLYKIDKVFATIHKKSDRVIDVKKQQGDKFSYSEVDVRNYDSVLKFVNDVETIDVGINCIGIIQDSTIPKLSVESWQNVLQINLTGTFNTSKSLFEKMKSVKNGRIINVSSIIGYTGAFGQANYSASKAGIMGLTKTMALEGAKYNILVNCVVPGYINSEMTKKIPKNILNEIIHKIPLQRLGTPDDVTDLIVFLASDHSKYITGEIINVDGGL